MVHFVKFSESGNGIVVSNKKLTSRKVELRPGEFVEISNQVRGLVFGFFGLKNATRFQFEKGEDMPSMVITDIPVIIDGVPSKTLFWAEPA